MHLPKDIIDRFSKWILYETGESIESIMGTQPPKEAPYKDISHILYGEPIDGGKIIYEGTSYKLSKNVNSKKNHIYVNKSESIINKLESVSLKQRGVKNYLKRHGLNDPEIKELNIDVISDRPTVGAEGYNVVFIHPKSTGGVLVELAQKIIS